MHTRQSTHRWLLGVGLAALGLAAGAPAAAARGVPDEPHWLNHLIPLPKHITIEQTVTVPRAGVAVIVRDGATPLEQIAAGRVAARFGVRPQTNAAPDKFQIYLMVGQAASELGIPNADQAYVISPWGANQLLLTGLSDKGAFYAAMTLLQLLDAGECRTCPGCAAPPPAGAVTLPLVRVFDWPDIAERGQWDGSMPGDMERLAGLKMNLYEAHARLSVTPDGRGHAAAHRDYIEHGRSNAFRIVQIVNHLDQNGACGLYAHCPEAQGLDAGGKPTLHSPCCAQPRMRRILADWLADLASQPDVDAINVWLSEDIQGTGVCHCDTCFKTGQYRMEVRAVLDAWRAARQAHPALDLRILLTQGTEWYGNEKVVAEIPPEVGISYYSGGNSYNVTRDPMIPPLLEQWAAKGNWLGVYPTLEPQYDAPCPWSCAQFAHFRTTEMARKKLRNMCAFVQPGNRFYDLNVTGSAEWSWNAGGRTPRELAVAWATRRGFKDSRAAAEWALTLGPAGWDVYGYGISFTLFFDEAVNLVRARQPPALGVGSVNRGLFRYFPRERQFRKDLARCAAALALARQLDEPELIAETRVTTGFVTMLEQVYRIADLVSRRRMPSERDRARLRDVLTAFDEAALDTAAALAQWERLLRGNEVTTANDVGDTLQRGMRQMAEALAPFGVRSPYTRCAFGEVGAWADSDFAQGAAIRKTWDVTAALDGPGAYEVKFAYRGGYHGLTASRVAFASGPAGIAPDAATEICADAHPCFAGGWAKGNVYTLTLPDWDSVQAYTLAADLGGRCETNPLAGPATRGVVLARKVLKPGARLAALPLQPAQDEIRHYYEGPQFKGQGIRVGVVQGGYGSPSILRFLADREGYDAQPIYSRPDHFRRCQVIVYPQPHRNAELDADALAALRAFVRRGGGLVATHDAPGYRACPVLLPEVCATGTLNVVENQWRVAGEHPLAAGLEAGRPLAQTYYDLITLAPGPRGTVVGRSFHGGQPVVIAGPAGKGRYVACGLCIGLTGANSGPVDGPPSDDEGRLLENAIRWAAGQ